MDRTKKVETEKINLPETLESYLVLEGDVPKALLLEQTEAEKASGTLRVKMPFYIAESIAKTPHIPRRVYFPASILAETISEGKKQINSGKQPLTVFARHAHAMGTDHLPIGSIVDLEQEGRIGYATLEIEPTTLGKDAQILLRAEPPKLNAISLRSGPKRFEMEEIRVNGEVVYTPTKLLLDGVDFAPNSPAMATYGREILVAEASITPIEKKKEVLNQVDDLTLETVRAHPSIVSEIEKPLITKIDTQEEKIKELTASVTSLTAEIGTLREDVSRRKLNDFVAEMASKHPKKEEALALFMEVAADCKTEEEFSAKILPHFVAATAELKPKEPTETLKERVAKLFPQTNSISLTQETEEEEEEDTKVQRVGPLEVPS